MHDASFDSLTAMPTVSRARRVGLTVQKLESATTEILESVRHSFGDREIVIPPASPSRKC